VVFGQAAARFTCSTLYAYHLWGIDGAVGFGTPTRGQMQGLLGLNGDGWRLLMWHLPVGGTAAVDATEQPHVCIRSAVGVRWERALMSGLPRPSSSAARLAAVFVLFACCAVRAAPAAAARSHGSAGVIPAANVVLGGSFHPVGVAPASFVASGDYVLFSTAVSYGADPAWIVINDKLGTTTALDPRCWVWAVGPPWVLMSCPLTSNLFGPSNVELYSLTDGTQQTVTPGSGIPPRCPQSDINTECASPAGVGASWIRWDASCYHSGTISYFQNIQTGAVQADPTNETTYADLNSPTLAEMTCPGVQRLRGGSLTPYGQFALATGTDSRGNPTAFLERCGTATRRLLAAWPLGTSSQVLTSNAGAIVWQPAPNRPNEPYNRLDGLFLPTLQTFTIPLPSAIVTAGGFYPIALTSGGLYLRVLASGMVWRTTSPTALPLNTSRPTLTRSGNTLTCTQGSWGNADSFAYEWQVNGTAEKDANPTLAIGKARKERIVSCSVTASNANGTTTVTSAQLRVRRTPTQRRS
jgi:hypothetical protein